MADERPLVRRQVVNNLGFWTVAHQQRLEAATVAVAGLGGAGGMVVELLARAGVRSWRLADPDTVELANVGRQAGAYRSTVGLAKVEAIRRVVHDIDPDAEVAEFRHGVSESNVDAFVDGADLVLEAIAFERAWLSVLLGRVARAKGIPMVTSIEIGDGAQYTAFRPDPQTYEETSDAYFGVAADAAANEDLGVELSAMLTWFPPSFPAGLLDALTADEVGTPAHSMGVARNASAVARAIRELIFEPDAPHPFLYPSLVIDEPDPSGGVFIVEHQDRGALLAQSFDDMAVRSDTEQGFSTRDEYRVID